jgi:predicted Zn-dependent protease
MAALTAIGKPGEAAAIGKKLLQTDPANPLTARLMATALAKAGSAAEAERYVKETDRLLAGDAKARETLASDLRRLGQ